MLDPRDLECVYVLRFLRKGRVIGGKVVVASKKDRYVGRVRSLSHITGITVQTRRVPLPRADGADREWE